MTELNLNRERLALLRDIGAGNITEAQNGRLLRRTNQIKIPVNMRHLAELQAAELVTDDLQITDAGRAHIPGAPKQLTGPLPPRDDYVRTGLAATQNAVAAPTVVSVLRWEDPPETPRAGRWRPVFDWYRIAAQLRDRPGQWALVLCGGHNSNVAANVRDGSASVALRPAGAFDAKSVRADGEYRLYVRYVGEAVAP